MEDIIQAFQARRDLLAFLGLSLYKDPNEELLGSLDGVVQRLEALEKLIESERYQEGLALFRDFIQRVAKEQDNPGLLKEAATEYAKLFIIPPGVSTKESPYPYESLFRGKHKMLMDEPRDEVYKAYWMARFELKQESNEPEDHLGLELLFLARLSERIADTLKEKGQDGIEEALKDVSTSIEFLKAHPLSFVDKLTELVLSQTGHSFYRGLALTLPPYLRFDLAYLEEAREHFSESGQEGEQQEQ
jgi:TorA maturation chaperone TorD